MIAITDYTTTVIPTQNLIVNLLTKAGPAELLSDGVVTFTVENRVIRVSGDGLEVIDGVITSGTVARIEVANAFFFLPLDTDPSHSGVVAPIVYDPRIGAIDGLDWSADTFNTLIDIAESGYRGPMLSALTKGGVTYQDSYYDNVAKGGRGDDLFLDRSGTDSYDGRQGSDTLSYEFSSLGGAILPAIPGGETVTYSGISADLRAGTVDTIGYPPPIFLTGSVDSSVTIYARIETDTIRNIENLTGSVFDDRILGDSGANILRGLEGDDVIRGRGGNDMIEGGDGDDRLAGNFGKDTISSGDGFDIISGGPGADTFVFALNEDGRNVIRDFDPDKDDIELNLLGFDLSIRQVGDNVVIRHTDDPPWVPVPGEDVSMLTVVLRDTLLSDLVEGDNLQINYALYML